MYRRILFILLALVTIAGCGGSGAGSDGNGGFSGLSAFGVNGGASFPGVTGPNVGPGTGSPIVFGPDRRDVVLTEITVAPPSLTLAIGGTATLTVTGTTEADGIVPLPGDTTAVVTFELNDPLVASVSQSGLVTAIAVGATQVTVTVVNGGVTFTETVEVFVTPGGLTALAYILVSNPTPNGSGGSMSSIAVAPDGTLSVVDDNSSVNRVLGIAATPSGDFVYAGSFFGFGGMGSDISIFSVNRSTGFLTFLPPPVLAILAGVQKMVIDPTGRFLYVREFTAPLSGFVIGNDGSLTPNPAVLNFDSGAGGSTIPVFNAVGDRMYLADAGDDSIVTLIVSTLDGGLTSFGPEVPAGNSPRNLALGADGNFLYVSNADAEVRSFSGADSGNLLQVDFATVDPNPGPMAVHPTLPILYVAGTSDTVQAVPLEPLGGLGLPAAPLPTGNRPTTVLVAPGGNFLYVVCRGNSPGTPSAISAYSINGTTGQLTFLQDYEFSELSFPSDAVIVPSVGL